MLIALWLILFWDNIVCYLNCLKDNEAKLFYQRWREKEAEALKGNRTVNWHVGKMTFASFCFSKFSLSLSLVKFGVNNIDLEHLYFSFLESYFYGQLELRFRFILSSTWSVLFRLFQRAFMEVHPSHPAQACLICTFFPLENPVESFFGLWKSTLQFFFSLWF